jgi:hypothetical protein
MAKVKKVNIAVTYLKGMAENIFIKKFILHFFQNQTKAINKNGSCYE